MRAIVSSPSPPRSPFLGGAQRALRIYYGLSCEHFPRRCPCLPIVGCFLAPIFHADCSLNVQPYHRSINQSIGYIFCGMNPFEANLQKLKQIGDKIKCEGVRKVSNDQIECWEEAQLGYTLCITQEAGAQLGHTGAGDSTRRIPRRPN